MTTTDGPTETELFQLQLTQRAHRSKLKTSTNWTRIFSLIPQKTVCEYQGLEKVILALKQNFDNLQGMDEQIIGSKYVLFRQLLCLQVTWC